MMHALGNAHSECHFAQNVRSLPRCPRRDIAPWFNRFLLWLLLPIWSGCSRSFASSNAVLLGICRRSRVRHHLPLIRREYGRRW